MSKLKGIIFGIRDVIVRAGEIDHALLDEIGRLIRFVRGNGITPVFLANRDWTIREAGSLRRLQDVLTERWGNFPWYIHQRHGTPPKPQANAVNHVLRENGWAPTEVVYIGNSEDDMKTAVNGNLLFLNVTWYERNTTYGFEFTNPRDVARFVDTFCLRDHLWHYKIEDADLAYYALSPFSTYLRQFSFYSEDARGAAKWGGGHPDFWTKYLWSTIYFSGLHMRFDYAASYPGHRAGSVNAVMAEALAAFAKCFRKKFFSDLVVRHTTATKSATTRAAGGCVDHLNQLNTIKINRSLQKGNGEFYKKFPISRGKTVLLVDDFCTRGYSLEAGRLFIEQTGASVICLSWLKTINSDYTRLVNVESFDPYNVRNFALSRGNLSPYPYKNYISDPYAPEEIDNKLRAYDTWDWPCGV